MGTSKIYYSADDVAGMLGIGSLTPQKPQSQQWLYFFVYFSFVYCVYAYMVV